MINLRTLFAKLDLKSENLLDAACMPWVYDKWKYFYKACAHSIDRFTSGEFTQLWLHSH